ncbi:hypothetical protein MTR_4g046040 [Medicago truncatula]|uniref:Uncharacterized protein n=1 Tax=Medicago truncatula TaxID=3880 RepID=A0A072UKJ2_MEDTR|nr:hypothetical protein MTR_4g046040 [Medicago truncatula]
MLTSAAETLVKQLKELKRTLGKGEGQAKGEKLQSKSLGFSISQSSSLISQFHLKHGYLENGEVPCAYRYWVHEPSIVAIIDYCYAIFLKLLEINYVTNLGPDKPVLKLEFVLELVV